MTISCCIHCWFMCPRLCLFFTRVDQKKKKAPTHKMPLCMMITRSSNKNFDKEEKKNSVHVTTLVFDSSNRHLMKCKKTLCDSIEFDRFFLSTLFFWNQEEKNMWNNQESFDKFMTRFVQQHACSITVSLHTMSTQDSIFLRLSFMAATSNTKWCWVSPFVVSF